VKSDIIMIMKYDMNTKRRWWRRELVVGWRERRGWG
jgi:hypothetical protein